MDFIEKMNYYENNINKMDYFFKKGKSPVLLIAVHTVFQKNKNKLPEPYTAAIVQYISDVCDCCYAIKGFDNDIDSNSTEIDEFKKYILNFIDKNEIKLVFDIHGASINQYFDVELGYLDGLSSDLTIVKSLETLFKENGVQIVEHNHPFKGGGITRTIFENTNIDVIQIEINKKFRDEHHLEECQKICTSLISFIEKYVDKS